jgi:hypothetical protein
MNTFFSKTNMLISSIIFIMISYFGYHYFKKNEIEIQLEPNLQIQKKHEKPRITSKDIDKHIQKEFSDILKIFAKEVQNTAKSMSEFNHDFILKSDYLNFRNNLFTKDIEKHHILINSKSITHSTDHNTSNYQMILHGNNTNNYTSGFYKLKNIIGFRLIKATIPSSPYTVTNANNKLVVTYNGGDPKSIELTKGFYDSKELADHLQKRLNEEFTTNDFGVSYKRKNTHNVFPATESLDFNTEMDDVTIGNNRYIIFHKTNVFTINWNVEDSSYRLFGFLKIPGEIVEPENGGLTGNYKYIISNNTPDQSNHFVDLVIPEIPYMACKKNPHGKHVIDRIPITEQNGKIVEYFTPLSEYFTQNYFFPLALSSLTIQLYEDSSNNLYDTDNIDNSFDFEITMIKNTENMNKPL